MFDIIIAGGGLSGLSSAVELSALGYKVLLLEQNKFCGGRTCSFLDSKTGMSVDNGQHLMMGCYLATRRYLGLIGTENLASLQPALHIDFAEPSKGTSSFKCPKLPAPFHLLVGLLNFKSISFKNRLEMLKVSNELFRTSPSKEMKLDRLTADKWLVQLGQSNENRKYLWDIITVGALNNDPQNVSALMLFRVLRAAFLKHRENSGMLIPNVELNKLFIDPALQFINSHGGEVRTNVGIKSFTVEGTNVRSIRTIDGKELSAGSFISAVPWYVARTILPLNKIEFSRFISSPIISIYLWFDRRITDLDFAALPEMRIQWMFNRTKIFKNVFSTKTEIEKQCLCLVISGAQEYIKLSKEQLLEIALQDLWLVLPEMSGAKVVHSLVIKEKRATFIPSPGLEQFRPGTQTGYTNLFLAGDWTATGYPATIEGAILSGKSAAESVRKIFSQRQD